MIATATTQSRRSCYRASDHKTFPGIDHAARDRAQTYSGQLAAYRDAICAATGEAAASTWIHFPVLEQIIEVRLPP